MTVAASWALPTVVSAGDDVRTAAEVLQANHAALALVTHRGREVGVVAFADLEAALGTRQRVADVLRRELVPLAPATDLADTLAAYEDAGWKSAIRRRPARAADERPPADAGRMAPPSAALGGE